MKPYYSERGIQIFCGDCREILPRLGRFDLLLTDPPYGIGRDGMKDSRNNGKGRKGYEFLGWDSYIPDHVVFTMMERISNHQVIWGGNYFVEYLPPSMGWLVWDKGQRISNADLPNRGSISKKQFCTLRIYDDCGRHTLHKDGACHPTQKPVALMKWCLSLFPDAKTVLDPFLGSGTTLVAAKAMGLAGVGIEQEEKYCEIAANRLRQEVLDFGGDSCESTEKKSSSQLAL